MKEEKHVQVGSKERIGDVWYFSPTPIAMAAVMV